ncbi:MAG TPA: sugar phosphate nucleotidyltransferase [Spirochaetota bacterium]|nr:sugar phosphate nucleotidyltransferase [Spirochaetota bacterium]
MKAFILAAGYGERLRPLTDKTPKPLIEVGGIPAICYSIAMIKKAGVKQAVCNLHYRPDEMRAFFADHGNFGLDIEFSFEKEILGTGGGVKKCEALFDRDMLLVNSDIITDLDLNHMIEAYRISGSPGMVAVYPSAKGKGVVALSRGRVADFRNFLGTGIEATHDYMGVAVMGPLVFSYLQPDFSSIVYTGYTGLIAGHRLEYFEHTGLWEDIGSLDSLARAEAEMLKRPAVAAGVREILGLKD